MLKSWPEFIQGTYVNQAPLSAQRTINLYPERMEAPTGKNAFAFKNVPGISLFANLSAYVSPEFLFCVPGATPAGDRLFALANTDLLEISSTGTVSDRDNVTAGTIHSIATNAPQGDQLIYTADGSASRKFVLSTNTPSAVGTPPTTPGKFVFVDGYVVTFDRGTQKIYFSSQYDGNVWAALDVFSAEADPDEILDIVVDHRELWVVGPQSLQSFVNVGDPDIVFGPSQVIQYGAIPGSLVRHDNSLMFIGRLSGSTDHGSDLAVYRVDGSQPSRVSTHPIEILLNAVAAPTRARCFSLTLRGHAFYVISTLTPASGSGLGTSLVYDSATGQWFEWAHWSTAETFTNLGIVSYAYAYGKHLVTVDDDDFKGVYEIDPSVLTDALAPAANTGDDIKWLRRSPHVVAARNQVFIDRIRVNINADESVELKMSFDGGETFGAAESVTADDRGAQWDRQGSGRDIVAQIAGTIDTQAITIDGASIAARAGAH